MNRIVRWTLLLAALVAAVLVAAALTVGAAQPVRVAAASDLAYALEELVARFAAEHPGVAVQAQFGSSGNFFTQIQQGLPVDLFFSANAEFPERLEHLGLTEPGTRAPYATGRMVVWVSNRLVAAGLDPETLGVAVLEDPRATQIALANPVHAPYGRAAVTLLEHYGYLARRAEWPWVSAPWQDIPWEEMTDGLPAYYDISALEAGKPSFGFIYGENVSQAAQLAASSAGVGLFAYSLALAPELERQGRYWLAPLESHLRLEQAYVILAGQDRPEVRAFYDYVGSDAGREVLARYGFVLP